MYATRYATTMRGRRRHEIFRMVLLSTDGVAMEALGAVAARRVRRGEPSGAGGGLCAADASRRSRKVHYLGRIAGGGGAR
jgi:hypothetical protein